MGKGVQTPFLSRFIIFQILMLLQPFQTQQYAIQGTEVQNLKVSLKLLQDHNHQLLQTKDSDEYEKLVDFKTTIQQNKDMQEANTELKNLLLSQKAENDDLKKVYRTILILLFKSFDIS